MLGKVFRDEPSLPALTDVMAEQWTRYLDGVVSALEEGWAEGAVAEDQHRVMLRVVVDFRTWTLLRDSGLGPDEAWQVAARMVTGAPAPPFA